MAVAVIPQDLRGREDLTQGDINRIVGIRKERKKLSAKAATLEAELKATREAIAAGETEEQSLLASD